MLGPLFCLDVTDTWMNHFNYRKGALFVSHATHNQSTSLSTTYLIYTRRGIWEKTKLTKSVFLGILQAPTETILRNHIHWVYKTLGTFLILSCTPFCPRNSLHFWGAWTKRCLKHTTGMLSMLTPMLPTLVSSWLYGPPPKRHSWYTRETVEREKPSSVALLDTLKPVHLALTTMPRSKALKYFVLQHSHFKWHTYTIHLLIESRLKNHYLTCLLAFIYTDWSGDINKGSYLSPWFTWSVYVMERAGVPNVLYTQCITTPPLPGSLFSCTYIYNYKKK